MMDVWWRPLFARSFLRINYVKYCPFLRDVLSLCFRAGKWKVMLTFSSMWNFVRLLFRSDIVLCTLVTMRNIKKWGVLVSNTYVACVADETKPRYSPSANQRPKACSVLPGFSIIGSYWLLHMAVLSCTVTGRVAWNHGYAGGLHNINTAAGGNHEISV